MYLNTSLPKVGGVVAFTVTDDRLPQKMNALSPMLVTLEPMTTDDRLEQKEHILFPIDDTLFGIVIDVRLEQDENVYPSIASKCFGSTIETRLSHPLKVLPPIIVTLFGIVTDDRLEQDENAVACISTTQSPMIAVVIAEYSYPLGLVSLVESQSTSHSTSRIVPLEYVALNLPSYGGWYPQSSESSSIKTVAPVLMVVQVCP